MPKHFFVLTVCSVFIAFSQPEARAVNITSLRESVVKIYITGQRPDYSMPWQSNPPGSGSGSGVIIEKRRIITNAHVASDARFLQVQKDGDAQRYPAKVAFIGHDCDLAILTVEDETFFEGTKPVKLSDTLPVLNTEVMVLGYPTGGTRLSLTKGVVSRIDYSVYTHSSLDQHLVIQVDAAINPGNSGGPILLDGKVIGIAFQGLALADNIGYGIPMPVVHHFLDDIADGKYDGYPELGASYLELTNPALRIDLGIPPNKSGIVVYYLDPFGSAIGYLKPRDVLFSIDGHKIESDGNVTLNNNNVLFAEVLERKQCGQSVVFKVWRNNAEIEVKVPLKIPFDPFAYKNVYDKLPEYYIFAGLVFCPLNRECIRAAARQSGESNVYQLNYLSQYAKIDDLVKDRDEFVVFTRQLPHPVNTYTMSFLYGVVTKVNGMHIRNLHDLKTAMAKPEKGFHVIRFSGIDDSLILDAAAAAKASEEILIKYGVPSAEYFENTK